MIIHKKNYKLFFFLIYIHFHPKHSRYMIKIILDLVSWVGNAAAKHSQTTTLPAVCFTVGMTLILGVLYGV